MLAEQQARAVLELAAFGKPIMPEELSRLREWMLELLSSQDPSKDLERLKAEWYLLRQAA